MVKIDEEVDYRKWIILAIIVIAVALGAYFIFTNYSKDVSDNGEQAGSASGESVAGCGDGFCSEQELIDESCSEDCEQLNTGESSSCGDGSCDADEVLEGNLCPEDCEQLNTGESSSCGDGSCDADEVLEGNLCPEDCEQLQ